MAQILLIRHGQSANNAKPESERIADPGLTDIGTKQALATAQWLKAAKVSLLYCSPFLRSLESIRPAAELTNLNPMVRPDLCEQGGCYSGYDDNKIGQPGMTRNELRQRYPSWSLDASIGEQGWWNREYETHQQAQRRAASLVEWLRSEFENSDERIALMIHADIKRRILEEILAANKTPFECPWIGPLFNVGVTCLSFAADQWTIHSLNATNHLPNEWLTA